MYRKTGFLLIILTIAASFIPIAAIKGPSISSSANIIAGTPKKQAPAKKAPSKSTLMVAKISRSLVGGKIKSKRKLSSGQTINLTRRGAYSSFCIMQSCALLHDNDRHYTILSGPGAKSNVWKKR